MAVEGRRDGRLAPSGRSVSAGRRQPGFLAREEGVVHAGEEGWRSRCGLRADRRQTSHKRGRLGSSPRTVPGTTRLIGASRGERPTRAIRPHRRHGHKTCTGDTKRQPGPLMQQFVAGQNASPRRAGSDRSGATQLPQGDGDTLASSEAINASGALNRPRRSSGGTTASTASSFSDGSIRK